MTHVLRADTLYTGSRILTDAWVAINNGLVAAVGSGELPPEYADAPTLNPPTPTTIVPGYVDIHCHGGGGAGFGGTGPQAVEAARTALRTHLNHGTTTMVASLVTGAISDMAASVKTLGPLVAAGELAGIHLEGPWLSLAHKGAHAPELLRAPTPADIAQIFDESPGSVRMVTIAPELEGGLDAVRDFVSRGAIAAVGHTDVDFDGALDAINAGATNVTHLFNAMNPIHHRVPGPIVKFLEDPRITVELISDGVHLHPAVLRHAATVAGRGRVIFVTDSMDATDMADGDYLLGSLEVQVTDGVARLRSNGAIAGSTLTMERAVQYAVTVAGLDFEDALAAATTTPAAALGRTDIGYLEPGARADLLVLDPEYNVRRVVRGGEVVVEK